MDRESLKKIAQKYPYLKKLYRMYQYKAWFTPTYKKQIKGHNNKLILHHSAIFMNCTFDIKGKGNQVIVENGGVFNNVTFYIRGNENTIRIAEDVSFFRGGELWIEDERCKILIGRKSTFEDAHLAVTETGSVLEIGEDCMFANHIDVRTGDSHSIVDMHTGLRINPAKSVFIADRVWVGAHCSILKGASIASDCVVATRSLVTMKFDDTHVILGGAPAKIIKSGISWKRERV